MYHYAPPPRRGGGGGGALVAVLALGFVACLFVGGAVLAKLMVASAPASSGGVPVASETGSPTPRLGSRNSRPPGSEPGAPSGARAATGSTLYQVGPISGFGCAGRRMAPGDSASFETFLNITTNCLDRSWSAAFTQSGLRFTPPRRVFWRTPGRSPCGDYPAPGAAAFYCTVNNAIYIGVDGHAQRSAGDLPVIYNVTYARNLAHEYAHHVQEQSGILAQSEELRSSASSVDERNAVTRRSELQAQCFAGIFMAAVRPTFPVSAQQWQIALRDSYGRGDDPSDPGNRDHGSNRHYAGWLNLGYTRATTRSCNTWAAPAYQIS